LLSTNSAGEDDVALKDIDTFVFVMLENRSFDHMLGYLSLDDTPDRLPVDGLRSDPAWRAQRANLGNGTPHQVKHILSTQPIDEDPPHGSITIEKQINTPTHGGLPKMGGFVQTYLDTFKNPPPGDPGAVMGYYDSEAVGSFDFLARNYCVCDRWFTPLPLGTQANRLMAMSGSSKVVDNVRGLPNQELAYTWLGERGIGWRVYVSGGFAPFFLMMPDWTLKIGTSLAFGDGPFRRYGKFESNWASPKTMPQVIFIEPEYGDAPGRTPNDDHPPAPVSRGQALVADVYRILSSNPGRWARTLMIVTYDEHGGFFDHVPPLPIRGSAGNKTFPTTGPRVPALLISPHVGKGTVFSEDLDHTSFLQLVADRFTMDGKYSQPVSDRNRALGRLSHALLPGPRPGPVPAMPALQFKSMMPLALEGLAMGRADAPPTPNALALDTAARRLAAECPEVMEQPEWREMKAYLESNLPPVPKRRDNVGRAPIDLERR
jgi:phospholipase C